MGASEKAVAAVMEAICAVTASIRNDRPHGLCTRHSRYLTERGCPVAVAAADLAVDTDRPSIQARALREAAEDVDVFLGQGYTAADDARASTMAATWLRDRADRIEAQP